MICFMILLAAGSEVEENISKSQYKLELFRRAREFVLNEKGISHSYLTPITDSPEPSDWQFGKFIPKFIIEDTRTIAEAELFQTKIYKDFGVGICYDTGEFELHDISGEIHYRENIGVVPIAMSVTISYEDLKIGFLTEKSLKVYDITMDKPPKDFKNEVQRYGLQTDKVFIQMKLLSEVSVENRGSSIIFFMKTGNNFWVTGDENGGLNFRMLNGTMIQRSEMNKGKILSLDRFGNMLIFGTPRGVGLVSSQNFELQSFCEAVIYKQPGSISDVSIDVSTSTSIVYGVSNSDLYVFDIKADSGCKLLASLRYSSVRSELPKISSSKNYLLVFSELGVISALNATKVQSGHEHPLDLQIMDDSSFSLMKGYKSQIGHSLLLAGAHTLKVYEVVTNYQGQYGGFDLGNLRIILIVLAVSATIAWQCYKRSK